MLPDGVLSTTAVVASSADPVKQPGDFLVDYERGGVALNDTSQGLLLKLWTLNVVSTEVGQDVTVHASGVEPTTLFSTSGISDASLAFDQNMRPFVTYVQDGIPKFYWYDSSIPGNTVSTLPSDCVTPRCCVDEKRLTHLDLSDILLAYIRAGNLCIRYQRERFNTEHILKFLGAGAELVSMSLNTANRIQFRCRKVTATMDGQGLVQASPYLADLVLDLCLRAGIPAENIDVSELYDDVVVGYKLDQDDGVDKYLEPLSQAFFFDPTEFDKKLRFFKRGRSVVMSVSYMDLVSQGADDAMKQTRVQEDKLPKIVNVNHIDPAGGYAKNKQYAQRKSNLVKAKGTENLTFDMVLTADQAATHADAYLRVKWHELMSYAWSLPIGFSALVPGDVFDFFSKDGSVQRIRITSKNEDGNTIKLEGTQDAGPDVYGSKSVGVSLPYPRSTTPGLVGATRLELLNIPVLKDQDDELGVYLGFAGDSSAWFGAQILISTDGGVNYFEAYRSEQPATLGDTVTALVEEASAEYPSNQSVIVTSNFPLESVDRDTLLNNYNRCVIGDEILQFQTAQALGNNQYKLSGLVRGRYNTVPDYWPIGTRFVLLDSSVTFVQAQKWMLGKELLFKPVSFGLTEDESVPTAYDFEIAYSQREWPPTNLSASRDGSNNVTVTWIPRPRLGVEISPSNSKYFVGYKVKFSDGFTATVSGASSYTRSSTPAGVSVTICGVNSITGDGDDSEVISV